ncbi:MAG: hypothetical protein JWM63_3150 [Gammaproteobacteria bacterium]|jgi:hypothetical protein|nr:hypothetical protein [Gammaproteobacteria bacterium]
MTKRLMTGLLAASYLLVVPLTTIAQEAAPRRAPEISQQSVAREKKNAAEAAEWNKIPAPQDPRDFSGVWWTRGYDRTFRPITDPRLSPAEAARLLPMTPNEAASRQHHLDMEKLGTPVADAPTQCFPHGVPRLIASPYPIQFVYSPGMITILHEVAHNVRYIHMDRKPAPADTPRTFLGYSVGRWEGNTLVVFTDHFNDRTQIDEESLSHGLKLTVTERISKFTNKYGGVELRNLITIEDPDHYTQPWTAERLFPWRGDIRLSEYSCEENNRNAPVNGVTVAK